MKKLRSYQQEAIEELFKDVVKTKRGLLCLPTGTGKTVTIAGFIQQKTKKSVLFLVNKIKLAEQAKREFENFLGEEIGLYQASNKEIRRVTVATVQSITKIENNFDLIIMDEAHGLTDSILEWIADKYFIGVTATPYYIVGPDKPFQRISYQKTSKWAVDNGFMVDARLKHGRESFDTSKLKTVNGDYIQKELGELVDDPLKILMQVRDALPLLSGRSKIVWACVSIKHCEALKECLQACGEMAQAVHSNLDEIDMTPFESGEFRHLCFVTMVSVGYDFPPIDAVVLMRPTRSVVLMVQTIGRGLRPYKDKKDCLVLDYGNVILNCGTIHNPIVKHKGVKKDIIEIDMKFCPKCLEYVHKSVKECECGHEFTRGPIDVLKNLEYKAYNPERKMLVRSVFEAPYISKSGKKMFRIEYETDFGTYYKYGFKKGYIDLSEPEPCKIQITAIKDGKYDKIIRVEHSEYDLRLLKPKRDF